MDYHQVHPKSMHIWGHSQMELHRTLLRFD